LWKNQGCPTEFKHIGDHIKKRRFELKMTAVECREILGVNKDTLADWEAGRHEPGKRFKPVIVGFLGYTPLSKKVERES
jgi:DNA-binding transcriptional regulator YiaG